MATCNKCEEEYSDKRLALGYKTCLECGDASARRTIQHRTAQTLRAMTPNHYAGNADELFDKLIE